MAKVEKVKARDRRAKEKALLKDAFALGRARHGSKSSKSAASKLRALIKLGKERGFLTYAEINDHLPDNLAETEAIEAIISTFNDMGVAVYEQAPDAETLLLNDNAPAASSRWTKSRKKPKSRCPPSIANSAARPTRCACTCAKWARSSC